MFVVIAGAGLIGGELGRQLLQNKHDVVVIDENKELCDRLYSETGVVVIHGSVSRIETLNEAEVSKADVLVTATGDDANNLACAILAKSLGVPRIMARMRDPAYEKAYRLTGVNAIVRVTDLMVNEMMLEIERPAVRRITTIGSGKAGIFLVMIPEGSRLAGMTIKEIDSDPNFPSECAFAAVHHQDSGDLAIPRGNTIVDEGDELFVISTGANIKKAVEFLTS